MEEPMKNTSDEQVDTNIDNLAALAEQTTQSTCSAVLLTARELIKSHNQHFAIEQINSLSTLCEEAGKHLETSQNELGLNNHRSAQSSLNQAIDSLMIVSNSALTTDITATNLASNDTALFRTVRK